MLARGQDLENPCSCGRFGARLVARFDERFGARLVASFDGRFGGGTRPAGRLDFSNDLEGGLEAESGAWRRFEGAKLKC